MPRMRMVKPEFWTDGKIVRVSRDARLLFIGTWNFADCDSGHIEEDALELKMRVFPADSIDVAPLLDELVAIGLLERFTFDGVPFLLIPGLRSHQKTDSRWSPRCRVCKGDQPSETSPKLTETHASLGELTETHRNSPKLTPVREGRGGEGKGELSIAQPSGSSVYRFDEFWSAYPRKVGKQKARVKYAAAAKRADEETIIAGAQRLATDPNLPERQYIPHPTTWLERDGWEDEPLPPRQQPKTFGEQKLDRINALTASYLQEGGDPWTSEPPNALPPNSSASSSATTDETTSTSLPLPHLRQA